MESVQKKGYVIHKLEASGNSAVKPDKRQAEPFIQDGGGEAPDRQDYQHRASLGSAAGCTLLGAIYTDRLDGFLLLEQPAPHP